LNFFVAGAELVSFITDKKCSIRRLFVNGEFASLLAFPPPCNYEWPKRGVSNTTGVELQKGKKHIEIGFGSYNGDITGVDFYWQPRCSKKTTFFCICKGGLQVLV